MPNMSGHNIFSSWHYSLAETMKNMFDLCWKKVILSTGSWWGGKRWVVRVRTSVRGQSCWIFGDLRSWTEPWGCRDGGCWPRCCWWAAVPSFYGCWWWEGDSLPMSWNRADTWPRNTYYTRAVANPNTSRYAQLLTITGNTLRTVNRVYMVGRSRFHQEFHLKDVLNLPYVYL